MSNNKYNAMLADYDVNLIDTEVTAKVNDIVEKGKANRTPEVLRYLLSTVEMTTLSVTDSDESVLKLVEKVNAFFGAHPELTPFATICVYPNFVKLVQDSLEIEGITVACVTGAFPSAQSFIEIKTTETALAVRDGAEELDMVLSAGRFLSGDYETVCDEIEEIKAACSGRPLKVILETGALQNTANIKKASLLSMYSGADFIKTSTGMIAVSATYEAAYAMCQAISEYYKKTGRKVGVKISGGVKTVEDAVAYYSIAKAFLPEEWFTENLFRIGTSRLANPLISEILGEETKAF